MSSSTEPFYKMPTVEWLYDTFRYVGSLVYWIHLIFLINLCFFNFSINRRVDRDGSGQISADELRLVFECSTSNLANSLLFAI